MVSQIAAHALAPPRSRARTRGLSASFKSSQMKASYRRFSKARDFMALLRSVGSFPCMLPSLLLRNMLRQFVTTMIKFEGSVCALSFIFSHVCQPVLPTGRCCSAFATIKRPKFTQLTPGNCFIRLMGFLAFSLVAYCARSSDWIRSVAVSDDGHTAIAGCFDASVKVFLLA